jgi:hypothetical protein
MYLRFTCIWAVTLFTYFFISLITSGPFLLNFIYSFLYIHFRSFSILFSYIFVSSPLMYLIFLLYHFICELFIYLLNPFLFIYPFIFILFTHLFCFYLTVPALLNNAACTEKSRRYVWKNIKIDRTFGYLTMPFPVRRINQTEGNMKMIMDDKHRRKHKLSNGPSHRISRNWLLGY